MKLDLPKVQLPLQVTEGSAIIQDKDTGTKTQEPVLNTIKLDLPKVEPGFSERSPIETKYDIGTFPETDLPEYRGEAQPRLSKLGAGVWNIGVQMLGDLGKGASYLLDWEQIGNLMNGTEQEFGNWFSKTMDNFESQAKLPVYRTKESIGFHPESSGWWADMMPSLGSTLSLALPAVGVTGGLSKLGKALGGEKILQSLGWGVGEAQAIKGVSSAVISRYMENTMEGAGTFQEAYNKSIQSGKSEEEAKSIAGEAARQNWLSNTSNLAFDIPQYLLAFKTFKGAKKFYDKTLGLTAVEAGLEGVEESRQYISNLEAQRDAYIKEGLIKDDNSTYIDRLGKYISDPEFWNNTVGGLIGGSVFGGYASIINSRQNKQIEQQKNQYFEDLKNQYGEVLKNNEGKYNDIDDKKFLEVLLASASTGTLDKFEEHLSKMKDEVFNVQDPVERQESQKLLDKRLSDIKNYKKNLEQVQNEFIPDEIKPIKAYALTAKSMLEHRVQETNTKIDELTLNDVLEGNITQDLAKLRTDFGTADLRKKQGIPVKELEAQVNQEFKRLIEDNELHPEIKTKEDILKKFKTSRAPELAKQIALREWFNHQLLETQDYITKSSTEEGQKKLLEQIKKQQKEFTKSQETPAPKPVETVVPKEGQKVRTLQKIEKTGIQDKPLEEYKILSSVHDRSTGNTKYTVETPNGKLVLNSDDGYREVGLSPKTEQEKASITREQVYPDQMISLLKFNWSNEVSQAQEESQIKKVPIEEVYKSNSNKYPAHNFKPVLDEVLSQPNWRDNVKLVAKKVQKTSFQEQDPTIPLSTKGLRGTRKADVHILMEVQTPQGPITLFHPYNPDFYEVQDSKGDWSTLDIDSLTPDEFKKYFNIRNSENLTPDEYNQKITDFKENWRKLKDFTSKVQTYFKEQGKNSVEIPKNFYDIKLTPDFDFVDINSTRTEVNSSVLAKAPVVNITPYSSHNTSVVPEQLPQGISYDYSGEGLFAYYPHPNGSTLWVPLINNSKKIDQEFIAKIEEVRNQLKETKVSLGNDEAKKLVDQLDVYFQTSDPRVFIKFWFQDTPGTKTSTGEPSYTLTLRATFSEGSKINSSYYLIESPIEKQIQIESIINNKLYISDFEGNNVDFSLALNGIRQNIPYSTLQAGTDKVRDSLVLSTSEKIVKGWSVKFDFHPGNIELKEVTPVQSIKEELKREPTKEELEFIEKASKPFEELSPEQRKAAEEANNPENDDVELKVGDTSYLENPVTLSQAEEWIKEHLPKTTQLKDIQNIFKNTEGTEVPVGAVIGKSMYLRQLGDKSDLFHEAFELVLNNILKPGLANRYRELAKKEMSKEAQEADFRKKRNNSLYDRFTDEQVRIKVLNDYLSDKYSDWQLKKDEKRSIWRELFQRILDFVNYVFNNNSLNQLFSKIDRGAFVTSNIRDSKGVEYKLIPKLNPVASRMLRDIFTAKVFSTGNIEQAYAELINDYNPVSPANKKFLEGRNEEALKMASYYGLLLRPEVKNLLVEQAQKTLQSYKYNPVTEEYNETDGEISEEKQQEYDVSKNEYDPSDGISQAIRNFIQSTPFKEPDIFGRERDQMLPWSNVWNSMLPSLSVSSTPSEKLMSKMKYLSRWNPRIKAVYTKIGEDENWIRAFQQAFNLDKFQYPKGIWKNNTSSLVIQNLRDLGDFRFNSWKNWYEKTLNTLVQNPKKFKEAGDKLSDAISDLEKVQKGELVGSKKYITALKHALDNIGIEFTEAYLSTAFPQDEESKTNKSEMSDNPDTWFISTEDLRLRILAPFRSKNSPFNGDPTDKSSSAYRLAQVAETDGSLDKDLILKTYPTVEGKTRYSYAKPSLYSLTVRELKSKLNSKAGVKRFISENKEYWKYSPLLNKSEDWIISWANQIDNSLSHDFEVREDKNSEGVTSKSITQNDLIFLTHLYFNNQKGNSARIWLTQMADASTQHSQNLPIQEYFKDNEFTEQANTDLWGFFMQEVNRINGVYGKNFLNKDSFVIYNFLNNPELKQLVDKALVNPQSVREQILDVIRKQLKSDIDAYQKLLEAQGLTQMLQVDSKYLSLIEGPKKAYNGFSEYLHNFFLNDFIMSTAYMQVIGGDFGYTKSYDDYIKRAKRFIASGDDFGPGNHKVQYISQAASYINPETLERTREKKEGWEKNKDDDGQVHSNVKSFLDDLRKQNLLDTEGRKEAVLRRMIGTWDSPPDYPSTQEKREAGIDLINSKQVIVGFTQDADGNQVPVYHKCSVSYISQQDVAYWDSKSKSYKPYPDTIQEFNMLKFMDTNDITHLVNPDAAKQFFPVNPIDVNDFNQEVTSEHKNFRVYEIPDKYRRLQQLNETSKKDRIIDSNQKTNILGSEISSPEGLKAREDYNSANSKMREQEFNFISSLLVSRTNPKERAKLEPVIKAWKNILANSNSDLNIIELIDLNKYDSNLAHLDKKFQQLFLSTFRDAFRQKVQGRKLTLRSAAFRKIQVDKDGNYITHEIFNSDKAKYSNTKDYEVRDLLPTQYIKDTEGKVIKVTPAEVLIPRKFAELVGLKVGDALTKDLFKMIATRIPTQSYHSMSLAQVAGFLPDEYGDTIIGPSEWVYLTGLDYDIDKMYTYMPDWYQNSRKEIVIHGTEDNIQDKFEGYTTDLIQNNKYFADSLKEALLNSTAFDQAKKEVQEIITSDSFKYLTGISNIKKGIWELSQLFDKGNLTAKFLEKDNPEGLNLTALNNANTIVALRIRELQGQLRDALASKEFEKKEAREALNNLYDVLENKRNDVKLIKDSIISDVLEEYGLPITPEDLQSSGYEAHAALYNKMFNSMYDILSLPELETAFKQPLSTKKTQEAVQQAKFKEQEKPGISNNILAKLYGFRNATNSTRLRGVVVNANTGIQYLTEKKVSLGPEYHLNFDGKTLSTFDTTPEITRDKFDTISTIVGSIIDDLKDMTSATLNRTLSTLGKEVILHGLGANRETVTNFFLQPVISDIISHFGKSELLNTVEQESEVIADLQQGLINKLLSLGITPEQLTSIQDNIINSELVAALNYSKKGLATTLEKNNELAYYGIQLKVLNVFNTLRLIDRFGTSPLVQVLAFNNQLARDFDHLDRRIATREILTGTPLQPPVFNNWEEKIFTGTNELNYQNALKSEQALALYRLEKTPFFKSLKNEVISYLKYSEDRSSYVSRNLVSAFQMAVLRKLHGRDYFDYSYLVDPSNPNSLGSKILEQQLDKNSKFNLLLKVLGAKKPGDTGNDTKYSLVTTDSRSKLSQEVHEILSDSALALARVKYKLNPTDEHETNLANEMYKYQVFKNNLQFTPNDFIRFLPAEFFIPVTQGTKRLNQILVQDTLDEKSFKEITGMSSTEFKKEFKENFSRHNPNIFRFKESSYKNPSFNFKKSLTGYSVTKKEGIKTEFPDYMKLGSDRRYNYPGSIYKKISDNGTQAEYLPVTRYGDYQRLPYSLTPENNQIFQQWYDKQEVKKQEPGKVESTSEYTNYSGGATGGDAIWEQIGKQFGIKQVNYRPETLKQLTKEQLQEVEQAYQKAVKDLGRTPLSGTSFAGGLVRRDYLQAKAADSVFAISAIVEPGAKDKKGYVNKTNHQIVEGGTGYAVQMAINLGKPVYVFDQNKNQWYTWQNNKFVQTEVPTLTKKFAGIGTREINEAGKQAIRDVYKKTFGTSKDIHYQENPLNVKYKLKVVQSLDKPNAQQLLDKGIKNSWPWWKIGEALGIPKMQISYLQESYEKGNIKVSDIITDILASNTYTVEIKVSKDISKELHEELGLLEYQGLITSEDREREQKNKNNFQPTQYYSHMTVPGGTNYIENEVRTPGITPSIKGHAQFSTDNGIGWFRSDDQQGTKREVHEPVWSLKYDKTKTRRILEVQSDLFQKGRDRETLASIGTEIGHMGMEVPSEKDVKGNQFLQLLAKDNNWVTFFIKSIIQDSAKKGYEKVLFPTGDTAAKVEGHQTLEEFKRQKEDRIKEVERRKKQFKDIHKVGDSYTVYSQESEELFQKVIENELQLETILEHRRTSDDEIKQLKEELHRVETEGFAALRPIFKFYEDAVRNILKKNYEVNSLTDEYGNSWNEVTFSLSDLGDILLQKEGPGTYSAKTGEKIKNILTELYPEIQLEYQEIEGGKYLGLADIKATKVLVDAIRQKQDTLPHEFAHHYISWFRSSPLVQRGIQKYGSEEALVQAIGEQVVNQKGEATIWYKRFFNWIKRLFSGKEDTLQRLTDAFLTREKLGTVEQSEGVFGQENKQEDTNKEPEIKENNVSSLAKDIRVFLEKKLAFLQKAEVKNKAAKENQIKRLLSQLKTLDEVQSINTFIEDSYDKIVLAKEQFNSLIQNKDTLDRHELIEKLTAFNTFATGYDILDEISKADIEELFKNPGAPDSVRNKLVLAISDRNLIKQRYISQGIPLLADYLLEQKSTKLDARVQKEINEIQKRIDFINKSSNSQEYKERRTKEEQERINKLQGFNLDKSTLIRQLQVASKDEGALDFLFSPLISSEDSTLSLFAKSIKNELETARLQDIEFAKEAKDAYQKYEKVTSSTNNPSKFNSGIYEEIEVPSTDKEGNVGFIKKLAFVQKYDVTKFEKAKSKFFKEVGPKPDEYYGALEWNKKVGKWFSTNTQAKSEEEINKIISEKQDELESGIITLDEFKEWKNSRIVTYGGSTSYRYELSEPSDEYLNKKYQDLQKPENKDKLEYYNFLLSSYLKAQENLPGAFRKGYILPSIPKGNIERLQTEGVKDTVLMNLKEASLKQSWDTEYGLAGLSEEEAKFLPVFYTQQMEAKDVSTDLISSIMRFNSMSNRYKALSEINGEISLMKNVISKRKTLLTNSKGQNIVDAFARKMGYEEYIRKNGESFSQKHLDAFIDMIVYGEMQKAEELFGLDAGKLTNTFIGFSALTTIAGDLLKGTANFIQGNIQNSLEAVAGEYINKESFLKGQAYYAKSTKDLLSDFGKISPDTLPSKLFDLYDAIQGKFKDEYGREVSGTNAKKLFRTNTLFFNQNFGEHEIQGSMLFGILEHTKVKTNSGESMSLLKAYEKFGIENIYKETDFTESQRRELMNTLHALNKRSQGIYNEFDRGTAQRYALGRLAIMYRKHLIPGYKRRFKKLTADQELGGITEGFYRTFWNTFAKDLRNFKFNIIQNWSTYTPFEKSQIRKTITEITYVLALWAVVYMLKNIGGDDDKKKGYMYNFMLYQASRMRSETAQYLSPLDMYRVIKSPSAMTGVLDRSIKFTDQFLFTWDPDKLYYKKKTGIWNKGSNKSWASFLRLAGLSGYNIKPEAAVEAFQSSLVTR